VRVSVEPQRIDISVEPLDEYLVIQPSNDETETRSGLILPASAAAAAAVRTGIVTAVGSDVNGIEPGDKVLYPSDAGYEVRLGGIEVKVVKRSDLIARVHD
jgi:chaperonin GroES